MNPSHDIVRLKVQAGLSALAFVAHEYTKINPKWVDADDYIQTMIIFESLVAKGSFDHADLVARFRVDRPTKVAGFPVYKNGANHTGQMHRLRQDPNPLYQAATGFTSGCAMKSLPMGVWYREQHQTYFLADRITKVTHGTDEARIVGLLAAMRYRHALLEIDNPELLIEDTARAAKMIGLHGSTAWFQVHSTMRRAADVIAGSWGLEALRRLMRRVGMMYLSWSCPVSAIFWSYKIDPSFLKIFMHVGSDKKFTLDGEQVLLDKDVYDWYAAHLTANHPEGKSWLEDPEKTGRQDSDTFFSIAFSVAAVRAHDFLSDSEKASAINGVGRENWVPVLDAVEERWR